MSAAVDIILNWLDDISLCAFIYSFMYKRVNIYFRVHICM